MGTLLLIVDQMLVATHAPRLSPGMSAIVIRRDLNPVLGGPGRDCPGAVGVAVGEVQPNRAEQSESPSRSGALTMPEVLFAAGFRVHKYRNVCGCCAVGFDVIVFCLETGERTIRRLDGGELSSGNGGPKELADALWAAQTGSGAELSCQLR